MPTKKTTTTTKTATKTAAKKAETPAPVVETQAAAPVEEPAAVEVAAPTVIDQFGEFMEIFQFQKINITAQELRRQGIHK